MKTITYDPATHVLVPREPDETQLASLDHPDAAMRRIYIAMVGIFAAAPVAPEGQQDGAIQLNERSSMPVDMAQAKRWIVQLRERVDALLAIINEPATPTIVQHGSKPFGGDPAEPRDDSDQPEALGWLSYQEIFNAIAAAVDSGGGDIEISVKAFRKALAAPSPAVDALPILRKIAKDMRIGGAQLPAPPNEGTPESAMRTGLSIGLLLVEKEIDALKTGGGASNG